MIEECNHVPVDWFNVSETRGVRILDSVEVFRTLGHFIFISESRDIYVGY
jgi:hypothetical protein